MFLGIYLLSREGNSRDRTSKSFIDSRFLFYILLCGCQWLCLCPVNKISFIPFLGQRFIFLQWNHCWPREWNYILSFDFLLITGLGPKVFESVLAHLVFFWAPITCDKEINQCLVSTMSRYISYVSFNERLMDQTLNIFLSYFSILWRRH